MDRRSLLQAGGLFALGTGVQAVNGPGAGPAGVAGAQPVSGALYDMGGAVHNVRAEGYGIAAGASDVAAALQRLVASIASGGGTALFPAGRYVIGGGVEIPAEVQIVLLRGARLEITRGAKVVIRGSFEAGPYHVFGGAGDVEFASGAMSEVVPEWWGAQPGDVISSRDDTVPVQRALDTGRNVRLSRGVYGVTSVRTRANGQQLRGAGTWVDNTDPRGGTKIVRIAGSAPAVVIGNYMGQRVGALTLDGGAGTGDVMRDTGKNTVVDHVRLQHAVGGYCLHASGTNLCHYSDLYFPDRLNDQEHRSFGHIRCENALYSTFSNCASGMPDGGSGIRIDDCTGLRFENHYADPAGAAPGIHIGGSSRNIAFQGLNLESNNTRAPLISVDARAGDIRDVRFTGTRILQTSATSQPVARLTGAERLSLVVMDGLLVQDAASPPRSLIVLDGVRNSCFENAEIEHRADFVFIECVGTRSDGIRSANTHARGQGQGSNQWKCARLLVDTSTFAQKFVAGNDGATLLNIGAPIDTANVGPSGAVVLGSGGITDRDGRVALSAGANGVALKVLAQPAEPVLVAGAIALWHRTTDGALFLVARARGGELRKVSLQ